MTRMKKPPTPEAPKPAVYSMTLTPDVAKAIEQLSQDATDFLGRKVSGSAIIRALVRQVVQQGPAAADALFLEVERELQAGVRWGGQK